MDDVQNDSAVTSEARYRRHLAAYKQDLEWWRVRASRKEEPQLGSELHEDDQVFVYERISDTARLSLSLAGEHLRLAWTAIEAGQLYPSAHFTTFRGALVAASQALYILGPEDSQARRGRGLAVIHEAYRNLKNFHEGIRTLPDLSESEAQQLEDHLKWIGSRMGSAKAAGADKDGFNLTLHVVPYAAKLVYGSSPRKEHAALSLWRQMSGDAHALGWSMKLRGTIAPPQRGELLSDGTVQGSLEDIAEPFELSYRLLKRGWSLFDQRSEAGERPSQL